ncbi:hypothetical protein ACFQJ7_13585 [Halovenus rubra]|uniref:Uncharacterized protein n=2 Tax=Halovenus rubra TaxID=869890 RepID=A0ABD5X7R1_9EURY|nr:hypothetical protein [Halovenus rubra]
MTEKTVPFPELTAGRITAAQVSVAPDGTRYVVPSGMHERLRDVVVTDADEQGLDPKTDLAVAGWTSLAVDGMTDRVYVDAPDGFDNVAIVKRFARSHDAGSIVVAFHPSGTWSRWASPGAIRL